MKFSKKIEEIKNREENRGKIVLVRCGIFFTATGTDAILLNKLYGLKVTCFKEKICKVGVPVSFALKYLDLIEKDGYGYSLYDYDKETKELELKYQYQGKENIEKRTCKECKECPNYKESCTYSNISIYELLEQRKERLQNNEQ